jgi:hypothetical protein
MTDWRIEQVDVADIDGVACVTTLHWRANLSDGDHTVTHYGTVAMPAGDDPVPFAGVTMALALEWLAGLIDQDAVEQSLMRALALAQSPPVQPCVLEG